MIREATHDDMPRLLEMGESFFEVSGYADLMEYSRESTRAMVEHLIDSDDGILLVIDDEGLKGMIGALLYPFYMTGEKTGQELFWWNEAKGKGLALLSAVEKVAKEKGAKTLQ